MSKDYQKMNSGKFTGEVKNIKLAEVEGNKGYAFLTISADVPIEDGRVILYSVCFEGSQDVWNCAKQIVKGDIVEFGGYFHSRKQTDDRYKNDKGKPSVNWIPQLVLQHLIKV